MKREERVERAYQHGEKFVLENEYYNFRVNSFMNDMLSNDVGVGDLTSILMIDRELTAKAVISTEEEGIAAGVEELTHYYKNNGISAKSHVKDGDSLKEGDSILSLEGEAKKILSLERVGLNVIRRMCGIATKTREYSDLIREYNTGIAATRKTYMDELVEKKAVYVGGGLTHRIGLDSHIMIKDCHLDLIKNSGIEDPYFESIRRAGESNSKFPIEIEVPNQNYTMEAAKAIYEIGDKARHYIIMLDNMSPNEISCAIGSLKKEGLYDRILFEASGGIDLSNVLDYAKTGVDVISTSDITENASRLNIHQKISM